MLAFGIASQIRTVYFLDIRCAHLHTEEHNPERFSVTLLIIVYV